MDSTADSTKTASKRKTTPWQMTLTHPIAFRQRFSNWCRGFLRGTFFPLLPSDTPNALKLSSIEAISASKSIASLDALPLFKFKEMAKKMNCTVNDIIVTIVTMST